MGQENVKDGAGMTVSHPMWPGREGHAWYEYLGSIGIRPGTLKNCYVRKATITGLSSRQAVKISYVRDGVTLTLENVPVWIHTDIGTRLAMIKGVEQGLPEDYFKDAALMFPFPGVEGRYYSPEVLILCVFDAVENTDNVLAVIHILQNVTTIGLSAIAPTTYGMFVKVRVGWTTATTTQYEYCLYDIINDRVASIPTATVGGPALPFIDAEGLSAATQIDAFLSGAIHHAHSYIDMYDDKGVLYVVSDYLKGCNSMPTPFYSGISGGCLPGGGTSPVTPAWVQDRTDPVTWTQTATCCGGFGWVIASGVDYGAYYQHIQYVSGIEAGLFMMRRTYAQFDYGAPEDLMELSGTRTWSNGLTNVRNCEVWENYYANGDSANTYTETETISYGGASKTRTVTLTTGYTSATTTKVEQIQHLIPVQLYVTTPNFFSVPWVIDSMRVWVQKTTVTGNTPTYSCSSMSYADFGWQSDNTLINPTGLFDYVVQRIMGKFTAAGTARAIAASVLFYGFTFKATDLRSELLR
jgi:hypothetical protein